MRDISGCDMEGNKWLHLIPGDEYLHEFAQSHEAVGHEPQTAEQGEGHDDIIHMVPEISNISEASLRPSMYQGSDLPPSR